MESERLTARVVHVEAVISGESRFAAADIHTEALIYGERAVDGEGCTRGGRYFGRKQVCS